MIYVVPSRYREECAFYDYMLCCSQPTDSCFDPTSQLSPMK